MATATNGRAECQNARNSTARKARQHRQTVRTMPECHNATMPEFQLVVLFLPVLTRGSRLQASRLDAMTGGLAAPAQWSAGHRLARK
jgi:hypothetical protein